MTFPVGRYMICIGETVQVHLPVKPRAPIAQHICAYTVLRRVLATLRNTTAWHSGCCSSCMINSIDI